ncbi:zinc finger protein 219-like, partial [Varroa jacobsoni]
PPVAPLGDLGRIMDCDSGCWYSQPELDEVCLDDIAPVGLEETGADYNDGLLMVTDIQNGMSTSNSEALDRRTCRVCLRRWPDQWALRMHMRSHTQERPYRCPHCEYRAAHKSNLTVHLRRHQVKGMLRGDVP